MDTAGYFIRNKVNSWIAILLLGLGGLYALSEIGRLEDPAFTVKTAVVVTRYPGASPQQVEEEVTYPLESAIQQLPQVDILTSISSAGLSQITVDIRAEFMADQLPQVWDELRRRVNDQAPRLPPGVLPPLVNDDFGDVFGIMLSISGPGYSYRELRDFTDYLRRELVLVPGVGKVAMVGQQPEEVQIEIARDKMSALGIPPARLMELLGRQNTVSDAGNLRVGSELIRLHPTGEFTDISDLEQLLVSLPGSPNAVYLKDIATVRMGFGDEPGNIYRANGKPALALGISFAPRVNVVDVGDAVHRRLAELEGNRPAGMLISAFYDQSYEVRNSVDGFLLSFLLSLLIVVGTLLIFMGLRSGLVIAAVLSLNVLGSLLIMYMLGIELQRISLGAMIIALAMLVDNAIVVVEGVLIGRQSGQGILDAINRVIKQTTWPLLGGTIIAILAFAPIGLSQDSTGEYCRSLFEVLLISLLLSWVTAITITPLFAKWAFEKMAVPAEGEAQADPYQGWLYRAYGGMLAVVVRFGKLTLLLMAGLLVAAIMGFGQVRQSFFPPANTPMFFVDLWLPQGTDINHTRALAAAVDQHILGREGVDRVVTTIGQGTLRFILTYSGERQYSNYAQVLVRTENLGQIPPLIDELNVYLRENFPEAQVTLKRLMFGPSAGSPIEARFTGADPNVLRRLGAQAVDILRADAVAAGVGHDWQARGKMVRPQFSEARGRELGIDKRDIDSTLRMSFGGLPLGLYRDGTRQMPIVLRTPDSDRNNAERLSDVQIWSNGRQSYVPIEQVVSAFLTQWEDPLVMRRDRKRTLTVQSEIAPESGETSDELLQRVKARIEAIPLPVGYQLEWGGDYESSRDARAAVFGSLPMAFLAMFLITVLMFGSVGKASMIWATIPLAMIGVTLGFLVTGIPFGFMALLGLLSLSGMLIRNGIVLMEEIRAQLDLGKAPYDALIYAATSRLRPICLTALTTILGLAPLLFDAFFQSMAVVIMFGLGFATLLTLLVLPVMYSTFNGIRKEPKPT
ncbi:efflux RND transporter permease subunit [Metapseudomonas resinovorans]|uniref:Triclosan efflux pump membrane protein TriC n=1 Tax=Metapseudomonas resinovorans NBRC 106553 TaxID=1245471 RepID=S6B267_METRE|nr:efflux RND transporter permease subunit [Pseudomonas resinovorans]BAN51301.1 triclosan efflux pump membrane protein TriC [Pseudomonas resinovorans NBRC 106553]